MRTQELVTDSDDLFFHIATQGAQSTRTHTPHIPFFFQKPKRINMSSSRYPGDARKRKDKDKEKEREQERDGKVNKRTYVFHTKEGKGTPEEPTGGTHISHTM